MSRTQGLLQCLPPRDELYHYLESFGMKARGFAFPYVPEDLAQKEVERFLENAEENADKVPDMLALIFAALALGVQLDTFGSRKNAGADVSPTSSRRGEIFCKSRSPW